MDKMIVGSSRRCVMARAHESHGDAVSSRNDDVRMAKANDRENIAA